MLFTRVQNSVFFAFMAASIVSGYPIYQNTEAVLSARENIPNNNGSTGLDKSSANSDTGVPFKWNINGASTIPIQDSGLNQASPLHLGNERNTLPEIYLHNRLHTRDVAAENASFPDDTTTADETNETTLQIQVPGQLQRTFNNLQEALNNLLPSKSSFNLLQQALLHRSALSLAIHKATAKFENLLVSSSDFFKPFYLFDIALSKLASAVPLSVHGEQISIDLINLTPEYFELAIEVKSFLEDLVRRYINSSKALLLAEDQHLTPRDIDADLDVDDLAAIAKDDNFIEIFRVGLVEKIKEARSIQLVRELELEEEEEEKKEEKYDEDDDAKNLEQELKKATDAYVTCKVPGLCVFTKLGLFH